MNRTWLTYSILALTLLLGTSCDAFDAYEPAEPWRAEVGIPIADYLETRPDIFSILNQAIARTDLKQTLNSGEYTFLAPRDEAFQKYLDANDYSSINDVPLDQLRAILEYHTVPARFLSTDLQTTPQDFPTLHGTEISVWRSPADNTGRAGYDIFLNSSSKNVVTSNIEATNGIVHVLLDAVLIP